MSNFNYGHPRMVPGRGKFAGQDRPAVKQQAPAEEPFSIELLRDRFRVAGELTSKADAEKLIEMLKLAANFLPETPTPIAEIDDDDEPLSTRCADCDREHREATA